VHLTPDAKPARRFTCRPYSGAPAAATNADAAGANAAGVTLVKTCPVTRQRTGPRRLERVVRCRLPSARRGLPGTHHEELRLMPGRHAQSNGGANAQLESPRSAWAVLRNRVQANAVERAAGETPAALVPTGRNWCSGPKSNNRTICAERAATAKRCDRSRTVAAADTCGYDETRFSQSDIQCT
jgi:hypothetical protein